MDKCYQSSPSDHIKEEWWHSPTHQTVISGGARPVWGLKRLSRSEVRWGTFLIKPESPALGYRWLLATGWWERWWWPVLWKCPPWFPWQQVEEGAESVMIITLPTPVLHTVTTLSPLPSQPSYLILCKSCCRSETCKKITFKGHISSLYITEPFPYPSDLSSRF